MLNHRSDRFNSWRDHWFRYDYFSMPQKLHSGAWRLGDLQDSSVDNALESIPATCKHSEQRLELLLASTSLNLKALKTFAMASEVYISHCEFFFILHPTAAQMPSRFGSSKVPNPDGSELFGFATWASRGWCRMERAMRSMYT